MARRAREPARGGRAVAITRTCRATASPEADAAHVARRARSGSARCTTAAGPASRGRSRRAGAAAPGWQQRIFNEEQARFDVAVGAFAVGIGMAGPDDHRVGHRRAAGAVPARDAARRRDLVPAVLRAGRGLRPRRAADPRRRATATSGSSTVRRCGRRARTTATGACCSRAPIPMCRSTGASRPSSLDMRTPGHRRAPAAPDHRRVALQRGVPHRRAHPRRDAARSARRGLARRQHDAVERAGADRRRRPGRVSRTSSRSRSAVAATPTTRCCARSSPGRYTRLQVIKWLGWRARSRKDQGLGPEASVLKLAASRRLALRRRPGARAARRAGDALRRRRGPATATGSSSSSGNGAADSAAAPSRSSATSSASGCSACPASRASTRTCPSASSASSADCAWSSTSSKI